MYMYMHAYIYMHTCIYTTHTHTHNYPEDGGRCTQNAESKASARGVECLLIECVCVCV